MYAGNILKNSNVYCLSKCVVGSLARNQIIYVRFVFCCCMCNFLFAVRVCGLLSVKVVSLVVLHILMCVKVVVLVVFQVGIGLFTLLCVFICVCIC